MLTTAENGRNHLKICISFFSSFNIAIFVILTWNMFVLLGKKSGLQWEIHHCGYSNGSRLQRLNRCVYHVIQSSCPLLRYINTVFSFKMPFFSFLQIYKPKVSGTAVRKLKGFPTDVVLENARSVLLDFQGNRGLKVMFMSNTRKLDISSVNNSEHSLSLSIMQPWFVLLCSSLINDLAS